MIAKELEQLLSMVPEDTPIRFEIEGVEAYCPSAEIKPKPFEFTTERGELSTIVDPEIDSLTISVSYGPEKVQE
jgi:hypothetical protein